MDNNFITSALRSQFYRKKLSGLNISNWEAIPFTTKEELRTTSAYDILGVPMKNIATYHETSGTTGTPTSSWYSYSDVIHEYEVILQSQLNLTKDDILLNRFPFALAVPAFILFWACQKVGAVHIGADKASMITPDRRVVEIMQRARPSILALLPSEADKIFAAAKLLHIPFPTKGLRALFLAGELVSPRRKKYFEELWGVPVFTFFGSTETGGLFVSDQNGYYHLNNPRVKIEVVDDQGKPVPNGVRGHGVFSTVREGMPLLRYYNHDLLEIRNVDSEDGSPILIHYGREENSIIWNGSEWTFLDFQELIYSLKNVPLLWKVKQKEGIVTFIFQFMPNQKVSVSELSDELFTKSGNPIRIKVEDIVPVEKLVGKPAFSKYVHIQKE